MKKTLKKGSQVISSSFNDANFSSRFFFLKMKRKRNKKGAHKLLKGWKM